MDRKPRTAAQATVAALDAWRRDWRAAQARGADVAELQELLDGLASALAAHAAAAADQVRGVARLPESATSD